MPVESEPDLFLGPLLGIVFDLDGTLVDSAHDFARMRQEVIRAAERHGVMPGHLSVREPIPKILDAALSELTLGGVPEGERFRFEAEANEAIDRIELEALDRTTVRAGAVPLLTALSGEGYRLGLLTRSSETFCRAALQKTGLKGFFANLRTRSSPGPAKPSPEALLALLREMAVSLDRAVFVGDHPLDAECATRARVRFLGVLPSSGSDPALEERLRKAGALAVGRDLKAIGQLLGLRAGRGAAAAASAGQRK